MTHPTKNRQYSTYLNKYYQVCLQYFILAVYQIQCVKIHYNDYYHVNNYM